MYSYHTNDVKTHFGKERFKGHQTITMINEHTNHKLSISQLKNGNCVTLLQS